MSSQSQKAPDGPGQSIQVGKLATVTKSTATLNNDQHVAEYSRH